jgi:peroxiredoxin Q/BCP
MCSLRDRDAELRRRARLFGVSYGEQAAMKRFITDNGLHMDMLCDTDKAVAKKYGAYGYIVPARVTFILDAQGIIRAIIDNVSVSGHAAQVIAALDKAGL